VAFQVLPAAVAEASFTLILVAFSHRVSTGLRTATWMAIAPLKESFGGIEIERRLVADRRDIFHFGKAQFGLRDARPQTLPLRGLCPLSALRGRF
jgi:hypothetical protein